jgi:hypothetical protein
MVRGIAADYSRLSLELTGSAGTGKAVRSLQQKKEDVNHQPAE